MKKILFALSGAVLLLVGCAKEKSYYIEQNPNRKIVEYTPGTFTMQVSGTLTADASYDWITLSQSGNTATFTVRRNTTGLVREADYTIAGETLKAKVFQRAHSLDAGVTAKIVGQGLGSADVTVSLASNFPDDYASWGLVYSTDNDLANGKEVPQTGIPALGENKGEITGLAENTDYVIWAYVVSTEGDKVYSNPVGLVPPVYVRAGEDLQAAIDGAKEFSEIRVEGGAVFGSIHFYDNAKNKSLSGGWNADFTEQSWDNLTVIDGAGKDRGIYIAKDAVDTPLEGYVEVSYFEIRNSFCGGGHGSAVRISGGPVTVHHCYIHHNEADRGTINTREDNESSDITVYDCIIVNNVANGHAAGVCVEDGQTRANPTHAKFYGNIIANNRSIKNDGYAGSVYFYQSVDVQFVNNTVINNFNYYEDNGNWWGNFYLRVNTNAVIANNLILRTWGAKKDEAAFLQDKPIDGGGSRPTAHNNIIEGEQTHNENSWLKENEIRMPSNFSITEVLKNPDVEMVAQADLQNKAATFKYNSLNDFLGENYMSQGKALGAGTVETLSYNSHDTANLGASYSADIKAFLEKIGTDINGNPFIKSGKTDIGAIQSK